MAEAEGNNLPGSNGPVLILISKRIRALRKKLRRISELEESVSQGKQLHKEQEELMKSKALIPVIIDELEMLRRPLAAAVAEEINLAVQSVKQEVCKILDGVKEESNILDLVKDEKQDENRKTTVESKTLDVVKEEKQDKKKKKNRKAKGTVTVQVEEVATPAA